ncbi:hypothetical protein SAMN02745121_05218 [Nannocystis exedens]|uniref:Uncharacterized protein n=1 Tax=Nannocystis exedens TaxID=54 RepID=A0A1I2CT82_9BACT|nr:hypothetical protein NAEX_01531 [Nannocystis exedens]SFE70993.1 hypothetical protein SAMN02745121_05218 [Nannocystis exedens]
MPLRTCLLEHVSEFSRRLLVDQQRAGHGHAVAGGHADDDLGVLAGGVADDDLAGLEHAEVDLDVGGRGLAVLDQDGLLGQRDAGGGGAGDVGADEHAGLSLCAAVSSARAM